MKRIDELTLKFADQTLSDDEAAELLALIESDPEARASHESLLQVEFALREGLTLEALQARVMERVDAEHQTQFTERTMTQIRSMPRRRRKAPVPWAAGLAMAASVALVAVVVFMLMGAEEDARETGAYLMSDQTTIERDGQSFVVMDRAPLLAGDEITVTTHAVIDYTGEATKLWLGEGVKLTVLPPENGKSFQLAYGELRADVAPQPQGQPLKVATPRASISVVGTEFSLSYKAGLSYLAVTEGAVKMITESGEESLVDTGRFAQYLAGASLVEGWINEPEGLVARWTFDDVDERRVHNEVTDGPNAKLNEMPRLAEGKLGQSLLIDNNQQHMEIAHRPEYNLTEGAISLWFKSTEPRRGMDQMLISKRTPQRERQQAPGAFYLKIDDQGRLHAQMYDRNQGEHMVISPSGLPAGKWQHAVLNFGPGGMQLYLNGQVQGASEYHGGLAFAETPANTEPILLGADSYWSKNQRHRNHFLGEIDDVRIYDRALPESDVQRLAQGR